MDNEMVSKWKTELETNLANIEKQISQLDIERNKIQAQLAAVNVLLFANGKISTTPTISSEDDATRNFLSSLKSRGWSITSTNKRANIYLGSRMGESLNIWTKFSRYYERPNGFWFGITPESLNNMVDEKGGVVFLLGKPNDYVCLSFKKLQELLLGATPAKTGKKIYIRKRGENVEFLPIGTDKWTDISQYFGIEGVKKIGLTN